MNTVISEFKNNSDWLSNFYRHRFFMDELDDWAMTGEHAFQALKTNSPESRDEILSAFTPGQAKKLGQSVRLRKEWNFGGRILAMQKVVRAKFSTPSLRVKLLDTGITQLIEGNLHHDNFWGDCYCNKNTKPCNRMRGHNHLGELLMAERARIRCER